MSVDPQERPMLEVVSYARGKRAPITCTLKCGDACAKPAPNTTNNDYFRDIASSAMSRRSVLGGIGVGALGLVVSSATGAAAAPGGTPAGKGAVAAAKAGAGKKGNLAFTPIKPVPNTVDDMTVPAGYDWEAIIRWGDPILCDAPEFDQNNQTPEAQAKQFGYNNDYLDILPLGRNGKRALLVANHEYTNEGIMFPPGTDPEKIKKIALMAHGFSVVELRRSHRGGTWKYQRNAFLNRRFTSDTEFVLDGPVAGSDLVKTKEDPTGRVVRGTLNNCAGSTTPWGTILSGEENFNQYFIAEDTPENARYGIPSKEGKRSRAWWTVDPRFDARNEDFKNEVHRFGWVVEIDPYDPHSKPVKHTALGRFKHEAAAIRLSKNLRAVAYSGDDERFDYLYKFVSKNPMGRGKSSWVRSYNKTLLSEGDLYVAKFKGNSPAAEIDGSGKLPADGKFDGTGEWIPLTKNCKSVVDGMSTEEVLVFTRLAADKVGATKMDRPEDVQPNPVSGHVYIACTNNKNRGKGDYPAADEANPRNMNREGHVIELIEDHDDAAAMTFTWNLFLVCGDEDSAGTYFGGYEGPVSPISCPDNVAFDSVGNLWVSTDGQPGTIGLNDGLFKVPTTGANRGHVQQFLAVPRDAETCGPVIHDKDNSVFVAVQHPGERGTWEKPTSQFPDFNGNAPRPSVVQVTRKGK